MSPDLDRRLCERYPLVFRYRVLDRSEHSMGRGFDCGDGWYALVDTACAVVSAHYESARREYERTLKAGEGATTVERARTKMEEEAGRVPAALQVKEKLGSLRIYFEGGGERARAASEFAQILSESVCELCARPGALLRRGGRLRTLCGTCCDAELD